MNIAKFQILGARRSYLLFRYLRSVRCPLATVPPFGTVNANGLRVYATHDLGVIPSLFMCFLIINPVADSAAVCACIRQEKLFTGSRFSA